MIQKISIRNCNLPNSPRVFDVTVDDNGKIIRYDMQNIRGRVFIEDVEVKKQIQKALKRKVM